MQERLNSLREFFRIKTEITIGMFAAYFFASVLGAFLIGWMVMGWWVAPVEWLPPEPLPAMTGLSYESKMVYVFVLSEWYAYSQDDYKLEYLLRQLDDADVVACSLATGSRDMAEYARLVNIAYKVNGYGCQ